MENNEENQSVKDQLKSETRRRIIHAGIKAFAQYGYHGMKIAAVAREAGVANGTFYLHFKDKQALFLEIIRRAVAKLTSGIFAAHSISGNAEDKERAEIKVVVMFAETNRDLMRVALESKYTEFPQNRDIFTPIIAIRERELKQGIKDGHINRNINPVIAARAEIGMILSVVEWWLDNREKASKEDLIETLVQLRKSWAVLDNQVDDIDSLLSQWDSRL